MSEVERSMEFNRLKWHCRRGMLELDILLEPFMEEVFETLGEEDKRCFRKLIECEDQDIFVWFMQKEVPTDPDLARIVKLILDRVQPENYNT
ncbi:succinate dehydrogenase assembly factor 2 [Marinomonas sp. 15G1-11]|uniref:FAD assembly factor SdhE n=1 Tax=Marinomonas phaeophyticola TaxID=3004091 RepID=A0ABT4JR59_9GAMM|nr:succinate dehydrogenase assembly factor 2 [Marinomonas sp. 15G1-11]MCZ2720823.1 succinate dehydrogenase assembly factor 2 [Marinomonas sp. 15G1-11]